MKMNKYGRELDLLVLLSDNSNHTAQQLADHLGVTRRNLYYYLDYLRASGFTVVKSGTAYRLDRNAPFFRRLYDNATLNKREAEYVFHLIDTAERTNPTAESIKTKLERSYNLSLTADITANEHVQKNIEKLKTAISSKFLVRIHGYSSPHSGSVTTRIVEPFLLMNNGIDVRCHEISSHQNKTFKVARMGEVEVLDVPWVLESKHKEVFTDVFMFSGEERHRITMRLGQLSHNLLIEEYPASEQCLKEQDGHWIFDGEVASFRGIGRFVLGLFGDIEVLGDEQFKSYLAEKISEMQQKISPKR